MNDENTEVQAAVSEARRAATNMIAESQWPLPATYDLFVEMIAAAYTAGRRDQLAEVVKVLA